MNRLLGGTSWSAPIDQVSSVDVVRREAGVMAGGLRRQLCLRLVDDAQELFVVNNVDRVATLIREAVDRSAQK